MHFRVHFTGIGNFVGQCRGKGDFVKTYPGRSFIDQVDCFIRHKSIWHVTGRQMSRGDEGLVGNGQVVVSLVAAADTFEYFNGLLNRRLIHHHRLEASFQRRISLDILAVLIQGSGPDALEFPPGQRRLKNIGRIYGTTRRACPNQHMQLINEKYGT